MATSSPRSRSARSSWSVKWLVPSFVAMPFLMIWYYMMVPASQQALLTLGIDTINSGTFSDRHAHGADHHCHVGDDYRRRLLPGLSQSPGLQSCRTPMAVLLLALMATGAGEYSREMLRKPYVIGRWMYSNGVRVPYVSQINKNGYLAQSNWVWNGIGLEATLAVKPSSAASAAPATPWMATARSPTAQRTRSRQHRQLHYDAARLQTRLALSPLHATDGRHQAGCQRSDRLPERAGESPNSCNTKAPAYSAEIMISISPC